MSKDPWVDTASSGNGRTLALLEAHPRVVHARQGSQLGVAFEVAGWRREVLIGFPSAALYGLVEFIDNNPLVCSDVVSVPGPAATLALIALAPLIRANLIADDPVVILNFVDDGNEIELALAREGFSGSCSVHAEPFDLGGVLVATVMVSIQTPEDVSDIGSLYDEQFGRSFYVRRDEASSWDPELVRDQPFAVFRVSVSLDEPQSLLAIRVMSDVHGKCGAAQVVHAMNVMCGFEESLGIS